MVTLKRVCENSSDLVQGTSETRYPIRVGRRLLRVAVTVPSPPLGTLARLSFGLLRDPGLENPLQNLLNQPDQTVVLGK